MTDKTTPEEPVCIWGGSARLYWAKGVLSVGGLYIGCVNHIRDEEHHPGRHWRTWMMHDEDGKTVGWFATFATEGEARDALVDAAIKELSK